MPTADASTGRVAPATGLRPQDEEIDSHGLTHPGKVRRENQDHFLLCSLRRQLVVSASSIPKAADLMGESTRLVTLAMVADGVGGGTKGGEARRRAGWL